MDIVYLQHVHDVRLHLDGRVRVLEGSLQPFVIERQAKSGDAFLKLRIVDSLGRGLKCIGCCDEDCEHIKDADRHLDTKNWGKKKLWQRSRKQRSFYHIWTISLLALILLLLLLLLVVQQERLRTNVRNLSSSPFSCHDCFNAGLPYPVSKLRHHI